MNQWRCIINTLYRCGLAAIITTLVAGCGSSPKNADMPERAAYVPTDSTPSACHSNPSSCIHKGNYESGEYAFARKEAERLNQLSLERLKRTALR